MHGVRIVIYKSVYEYMRSSVCHLVYIVMVNKNHEIST